MQPPAATLIAMQALGIKRLNNDGVSLLQMARMNQ
jgi:hypothetical protein